MIYMKRKKAFAFNKSLIIFMFIILIVSISINLISYNYMKAQTFKTYSDKRSLSIEEELFLKEINKNKNYNYKKDKYELIKKRGDYYLIRKETNSNCYFQLWDKACKWRKMY